MKIDFIRNDDKCQQASFWTRFGDNREREIHAYFQSNKVDFTEGSWYSICSVHFTVKGRGDEQFALKIQTKFHRNKPTSDEVGDIVGLQALEHTVKYATMPLEQVIVEGNNK